MPGDYRLDDPADCELGDCLSPEEREFSDREHYLAVREEAETLLYADDREPPAECDCEGEVVEGRWIRLYCAACRAEEDAL